jgi:hypothetical protein
MSKSGLDAKDFAMAPRRRPAGTATGNSVADDAGAHEPGSVPPLLADAGTLLQKRPAAERRRLVDDRAIAQEDERRKLKNLKRASQRTAKFFVNVALDQATKGRLARAAHENDVKMTAIMQAAIDVYLADNGY